MRKIALASDHAGFALKEIVKKHLIDKGAQVLDFGTNSLQSCHYPEFGKILAQHLTKQEDYRGIAFCGSGVGIALSMNKCRVETVMVNDEHICREALRLGLRAVSMGGRVTGPEVAKAIADQVLLN